MTTTRTRRTVAAALGGAVALGTPLAAGAQEVPREDTSVPLTDEGTTATTVVPGATRNGGAMTNGARSCGSASSSYKYSTKVVWTTVDVFRHANTTGVCEDDVVITNVYEIRNDCSKYAWGITYFSHRAYRFGPNQTPGTKSAFGTAECAMSIGGEIGGVGLKYTKQSNTQHTFEMQGSGAIVRKSHWTTTP